MDMNSNKLKVNKRIKELFDKDMKWTLIHEKIKARFPISVEQKDYYFEMLEKL